MHEDDFDAEVLAALKHLTDKQATGKALEECPALLSKLPSSFTEALPMDTPFERAQAFRRLLSQFFDSAYEQHQSRWDDVYPRTMLAVGALMGFVTKGPNQRPTPPSEMPRASALMLDRQVIAGSWILPNIKPRAVRKNTKEYLQEFRHALYEYLDDIDPASKQIPVAEVQIQKPMARPNTESKAVEKPKESTLKVKQRNPRTGYALIASVVVLAAIGGGLAWWNSKEEKKSSGADRVISGGQSEENKASTNAPVKVVSVDHQDTGDYSWVFEDERTFTSSELGPVSTISDYGQYSSWFTKKGAAPVGKRLDLITLEGNTAEPVEINGLHVAKECREPLSGTLFDNPNAGQNNTIRLAFDLDEQIPTAKGVEADGSTSSNYFARHTISLKKGERAKILVDVSAKEYYCEYTLGFKMTVGDKTVTQTVKDNGKPFKLSGRLEIDSPRLYALYSKAYIAGVLNPCSKGFKEINTQTYETSASGC
ncbi:hypothetical protein [Streptomyces sp. NPDC050504]|uniref:hypothetical protein n=1 Tax=Streptomyces sp. NPDC050504 TaxID=3365618 RepID=UPI0037AA2779